MTFLSYFIPQIIFRTSSPYNKKIEVREVNGRNVLLVNGIQQTGAYTEKLWNIGLQDLRNIRPKRVLVFGVGGGTVFREFAESLITGVDIDSKIIHIAKKYFGLQNATLIKRDARSFDTNKKYDLVIVDLYIGNDVPDFVSKRPFLYKVYGMLKKKGVLVMNYFHQKNQREKAESIARFFPEARVKQVLRNIFIYVVK